MDSMEQALNDAVAAAGGQAALARAVGVSQPSVWHWVNKSRRVAAEFTLKVEAATDVPRQRLRPDLYPPASVPDRPDWTLTDQEINSIPDGARRVIVCDVCEKRVDGEIPNACTFVDCPHSQRIAA